MHTQRRHLLPIQHAGLARSRGGGGGGGGASPPRAPFERAPGPGLHKVPVPRWLDPC